MLDPRIDELAKEIERFKKAILAIADYLEGIAWRVSTQEERDAGIMIHDKIKEIIEGKKEA